MLNLFWVRDDLIDFLSIQVPGTLRDRLGHQEGTSTGFFFSGLVFGLDWLDGWVV